MHIVWIVEFTSQVERKRENRNRWNPIFLCQHPSKNMSIEQCLHWMFNGWKFEPLYGYSRQRDGETDLCGDGGVACRLCAVADPYDLAPLSGHCHETRAMLMKQLSGCLSNFHLNGPLLGISQWGIYYCIFRSVIFIGALDFLLVNIRYLRLIV